MELELEKNSLERITLELGQPKAFLMRHDRYNKYLDENEKPKEEILVVERLRLIYASEEESFQVLVGIYQELKDIYDKENSWSNKEKWLEGIKCCLGSGTNFHDKLGAIKVSMGFDEWNELNIMPWLPFKLYYPNRFK